MTQPGSTQPYEQLGTPTSPFSEEVRLTKRPAPMPDPLPHPDAQPEEGPPPVLELPTAPPVGQTIRPPEAKPLSAYIADPLTAQQTQALDEFSARLRLGAAANLPMICLGIECKFHSNCPLAKAAVNLPLGQSCPVETSAIDMWRQDFLESYNVSKKHPQYALMIRLVNDMVSYEAIENRLMWKAAQDSDILKREVVGFSQQGVPIEAERLNPMLDYILRLKDRKLKALREMLATPRAEAEARRRLGQDPGSQTASATAALGGSKPAGFVKVTIGKKKDE